MLNLLFAGNQFPSFDGVDPDDNIRSRLAASLKRYPEFMLAGHLRTLCRYNGIANERLYAACAKLDDSEYRQPRRGSFGSIHGLLNHMLLGDRIWMSRFTGSGLTTPPLHTILFEDFAELRLARAGQDLEISAFFESVSDDFFNQSFGYRNNQAKDYVETATVAALHFFNHQTHHRGQVHVMLSQTNVPPPSLDMHRILNP